MEQHSEVRAVRIINASDFRGIDEGSGSLTGPIAKFNELNDHGEVYLPGSSKRTQAQFLEEGFNTDSHNWNSVGDNIGYPTEIHEEADGVYSTFEFHSTPKAQEVRTVAKERMAKKLRVGLSIGFNWDPETTSYIYPKDYQSELPKIFRADKLTELMQEAKRFPRIRVIRNFTLYEYSVVNSPSQNNANATQVRSTSIAEQPELRTQIDAALRGYLGEDFATQVTMSTIAGIWSYLMYELLYRALGDPALEGDDLSTAMCGMIDECSKVAQSLIPTLISVTETLEDAGETGEAESDDMMNAVARYVLPPNDFTLEGKALGLTLDSHARLALSASQSLQTRMDALVTMRRGKNPAQRKGATLSAKNVATLKAHADQAKSIYEGLCSMVKPEMNDSDEAVATDSSATEYIGGPDPLHNPKAGEVNASLADAKLRVRTRLLLGRANSLLN